MSTGWDTSTAATIKGVISGTNELNIDSNGTLSPKSQVGGTSTTQALAFSPSVVVNSSGTFGEAVVGYNAAPVFGGFRSAGTESSPTAVGSGSTLTALKAGGYDGTSWTSLASPAVGVNFLTAEAWSATAHGSLIQFQTTAKTTTTLTEQMRIADTGAILAGTTSAIRSGFDCFVYNGTTTNGIVGADNVAYNASPNSKILFCGKYTSGGAYADHGQIQGNKDNATDGNQLSSMSLYSNNGSGATLAMKWDSSQYTWCQNWLSVNKGSAPSVPLDVVGAASITGTITAGASASQGQLFSMSDVNATNLFTVTSSAASSTTVTLNALNSRSLVLSTNQTPAITIGPTQNVTLAGATTVTGGIVGTATNNNATAGNVGEYIIQSRVRASSTSASTGVDINVTSTALTLTAGDWDVTGLLGVTPGGTTSITQVLLGISLTSATMPSSATLAVPTGGEVRYAFSEAASVPVGDSTYNTGPTRVSISGTTTFYLVAQATFSISTLSVYGSIYARRVR